MELRPAKVPNLRIDVDDAGCGDGLDDAYEDNDTQETAAALEPGLHEGLQVTEGDDDWYAVEVCADGQLTATLRFVNADGDLDLALTDADGVIVAFSMTVEDVEEVSVLANMDTTAYVRVYGWLAAANAYSLEVVVEGC